MAIESENPLTVEQVMAALVAMQAAAVADPELRPAGPTAEDLPELLGSLLAKVELEIASLVRPGEAEIGLTNVAGLMRGWNGLIDDDSLAAVLLANRLQRTVFDLSAASGGLEEPEYADETVGDQQPIDAQAAVNATLAAISLIDAYAHEADPERVRNALDQGEGFLALALMDLHSRRLQLIHDHGEPPPSW